MAHTYIRFDFGTDEEKAQLARHKLDGWRQAFRLDKRVQYKLDRPERAAPETAAKSEPAAKPQAAAKSKDTGAKSSGKSAAKAVEKDQTAGEKQMPAANGKVGLLVRLYFSSHEKLSEQRWIDRIPLEEPFKSAGPKIIHQNDPEFEETDKEFESLT